MVKNNNIIDIEFYDKRSVAVRDKIESIVRKIMELLEINNSMVEITFISQEEMRKINKKYRNKDKSTNVLSFQFEDFSMKNDNKKKLGEIFISNGYINEHKQDIEYILLHGILHLIGFDHIKIHDRIKMEAMEMELVNLLKQ